jgi:hypothetical protein
MHSVAKLYSFRFIMLQVFITHAHGDHSFGLPGLLCLMGQDRERDPLMPLEVYGPAGLRLYLRAAMRYSYRCVYVCCVVCSYYVKCHCVRVYVV